MESEFLKMFLIASIICLLPAIYNLTVVRFGKYFDEYITNFCDECVVGTYTINKDKSVDVKGSVYIKFSKVKRIPFKFNNVFGNFHVANSDLTTLRNCPKFVERNFCITNTKITNLEYLPLTIEGNMVFNDNKLLKSLDGLESNNTLGTKSFEDGLYEVYLRSKQIDDILK